jgi:predicted metal-binding membrane protein
MLNPKVIGVIAGFTLGLVVICLGVLEAFILVLFVLGGWFIGKVWMGEIDLLDLYERFMSRRGKRPRR